MDKAPSQSGLTLSDLSVYRRSGEKLLQVNAHVLPGRTLTIMGPSGIGKSTLLAAITGTLSPDFRCSGSVRLNDRELMQVPPEQRRLGILFQDHLLFPHFSVAQNLAFGLPPRTKHRRARVEQALEDIDLKGFASRDPASLSGGQRARVALMRMLLSEPEALLLDEAFSRLDQDLRARMRRLVFAKAEKAQLPVILVTHDQEDAEAAAGDTLRFPPSLAT